MTESVARKTVSVPFLSDTKAPLTLIVMGDDDCTHKDARCFTIELDGRRISTGIAIVKGADVQIVIDDNGGWRPQTPGGLIAIAEAIYAALLAQGFTLEAEEPPPDTDPAPPPLEVVLDIPVRLNAPGGLA